MRDALGRVRGWLDALPVGISIHRGPDHVCEYMNPLMEAISGVADAAGRPVQDAAPVVAGPGPRVPLDEVFATGRPVFGRDVPVEMADAEGARVTRTFRFQWQALTDARGRIDGTATVAWEVGSPAGVEAGDAVSLFDKLDVVIYEMRTRPRRMVYINAAAEKVIGYERAEWEQADFWDRVVHPEDRDRALAVRRQAIARLEDHELEYRVIHRDGGVYWMRDRTQVRALPGEAGVLLRGVIVDVTALHAREQAARAELERKMLARRQASLTALARDVAEDFDSLVAEIHACASLLELQLDFDHPSQRMVNKLLRSAERARDRVEALRAFAGSDAGHVAVNLSSVVREIEAGLARTGRYRQRVRTRLAEGLPPVGVDPTRLEFLVEGLVDDAMAACDGCEGEVIVVTDTVEVDGTSPGADWHRATPAPPPGRYVRLAVADDGQSMSDATRDRVLGTEAPSSLPRRGSAISSAVGIARDAGGAVRIHQRTRGGTRVEVLFPAAAT